MRRFIAVLWLMTSVAWVALSLIGLYFGLRWLDGTAVQLDENLALASRSLGTLQSIINQSGETLAATEESLDTVQSATENTSSLLLGLRPLVIGTSQTITQDVPDALDEIQVAMPAVVETAKAVDDTLTWLSGFSVTIPTMIAQPIVLDLGVDYDPEVPLDESLQAVGDSIANLPASLRGLETDLAITNFNLLLVSSDLATLAENLETTNQELADIIPELEELAESLAELQTRVDNAQTRLPAQVGLLRAILWGLASLLVLSQIPGVYFGSSLLRRDDK